MSFAKNVINFYQTIEPPKGLPKEVEVLHPYKHLEALRVTRLFYEKYYHDTSPRTVLFGINPGRFGGGITGIPFTDPIRLEETCSITNSFQKRAELSSRFIYDMIAAYGSPEAFYGDFYLSAISPLGFLQNGKNLNYYDINNYQKLFEGYALQKIKEQLAFPLRRSIAYSIGQGQNLKFLTALNKKYQLFKEIRTVPHPRWVMQYRLKRKNEFIHQYIKELSIKIQ